MANMPRTIEEAMQEIEDLRARLEEAEQGIEAIRSGGVDAVIVTGAEGEQIYTLSGAERTYRILVEAMNEGALVLTPEGDIIYCNRTFAAMLGAPIYETLGHSIYEFVADADVEPLKSMLEHAPLRTDKREIELKHNDSTSVPAFISIGNLETDEGPSVSAVVTDLTEHKRTEAELEKYREHLEELVVERTRELALANEQLADSERRTISILESSNDAFIAIDQDWRFSYINAAAQRNIYGRVGRDREELIGKDIWVEFPELRETAVYESYSRAMFERVPVSFEFYYAGLDTWYGISVYPYEEGICAYIQDITERKGTEEALRESENRFRALVLASSQVVYRMSADWNEMRNLSGGSFLSDKDTPSGTWLDEYIPQDDQLRVEATIKEAIRTKSVFELEHRVWRVDGTVGWTLSRAVPLLDSNGDIVEWFGFASDITERKRSEHELAEAREESERYAAELAAFFSSMSDGVILFDAEHGVLMANEATLKLVGVPSDMLIDEWAPQHELFTLEGDPVPRDQYPSVRALRGLETKDARFRMVTPWKESLVGISGSPVRDAQGQVIGGTLTFRDVSKQVDMERYREELYQRELHITEVLQGTLIPQELPHELYGCNLAVKYQPALREAEVGGDFFDIFDLGGGRIGVIIGDVAGKGLRAAARVAEARYSVRSYSYNDLSPSRVLTLTNDILSRDQFDESSMLTAFFAVIDIASNTVTYANAGHEPPIVIGADCSWKELSTTGMPLGVMGGISYTEQTCELRPGDRVVMITDGISEARADGVVLFEKRGVIEYLVENCTASPPDMIGGLLAAATEHAGGSLQDDAALVVFECGCGD